MSTNVKDRARSSISRSRSYANDFRREHSYSRFQKPRPSWRPIDLFERSESRSSKQRPKTVVAKPIRAAPVIVERLHDDELQKLLRTVDHDEKIFVQVDCLANYRTLIQSIDLRATPLSPSMLCSLQQRENRIVQQNACRDTRFQSLLELLTPPYGIVTSSNKTK